MYFMWGLVYPRPMRITCPHCGHREDVEDSKIPAEAKKATCPQCGESFPLQRQTGFSFEAPASVRQPGGTGAQAAFAGRPWGAPAPPPELADGVPWENRDHLGLLSSFIATAKAVLFTPHAFYEAMERDDKTGQPIWFAIVCLVISTVVANLWALLALSILPQPGQSASTHLGIIIAAIILGPLSVFLSIYIQAAFQQLMLWVFQGANADYYVTVKTICYANATQLAGIVPVLGPLAGAVWYLVALIIGLKRVHETSYTQVILSMFSPVVLLLLLILAL